MTHFSVVLEMGCHFLRVRLTNLRERIDIRVNESSGCAKDQNIKLQLN